MKNGQSIIPIITITSVGVFLLPDDIPLAGADTVPHVAAKFLEAFFELSQYQIGEAFLS